MYRTTSGEKKFSFQRFVSNAIPNLAPGPIDTDLTTREQDELFQFQLGEPDPLILSHHAFNTAGVTKSLRTSSAVHKALLKNGVLTADSPIIDTKKITRNFAHELSMLTSYAQKKLVNVLFFWEEEVQRWKVLIGELEELRVVIQAEREVGDGEAGLVGGYEKRLKEIEGQLRLRPTLRSAKARENEELPGYGDVVGDGVSRGGTQASARATSDAESSLRNERERESERDYLLRSHQRELPISTTNTHSNQGEMARGKLIVFEGLDRSGKSSQCQLLVEALQKDGVKVKHMRFPDRTTPIGQMINSYLSGQSDQEDHVIHLLFSANRWEAASSIQADIDAGTTVIVDRYYYSGCVYSAAKNNPTLSLAWSRHPEVGLPRPDAFIFLDISAEDAAKRGGYGTEKYEKKEMQDRVRELFGVLLNSNDEADFVRIDAGESLEDVQRRVKAEVDRAMKKVDQEGSPLRFVEEW